jgi:hypothetical protein
LPCLRGACGAPVEIAAQHLDVEITDVAIQVELQAAGEAKMAGTLSVPRLGKVVLDHTREVSWETPSCLQGNPSIVVRKATARIAGRRVDLIETRRLEVVEADRYPIVIQDVGR